MKYNFTIIAIAVILLLYKCPESISQDTLVIAIEVYVTIAEDPNPDTIPVPPPIIISNIAGMSSIKYDTTSREYHAGSSDLTSMTYSNPIRTMFQSQVEELNEFKYLEQFDQSHSIGSAGYWEYSVDSSCSMNFGIIFSTKKSGLVFLHPDGNMISIGNAKRESDKGIPAVVIVERKKIKEHNFFIRLESIHYKVKYPIETILTSENGDSLRVLYPTPSTGDYLLKEEGSKQNFKVGALVEIKENQPVGKYKGTMYLICELILP